MYNFTQSYYDCLMEYVAFNQRSSGLLATTKYTGFVRWHERNHEVYDKCNEEITKYIANMYCEFATPKAIANFNYSMPSDILSHIGNWKSMLEPMRMYTKKMYDEACECGDFCLADKFKSLNKTINNECFELKRVLRRLKNASETDVMIVNKEIHDYFEKDMECAFIDMSM